MFWLNVSLVALHSRCLAPGQPKCHRERPQDPCCQHGPLLFRHLLANERFGAPHNLILIGLTGLIWPDDSFLEGFPCLGYLSHKFWE